jgi:hypothetical protein
MREPFHPGREANRPCEALTRPARCQAQDVPCMRSGGRAQDGVGAFARRVRRRMQGPGQRLWN